MKKDENKVIILIADVTPEIIAAWKKEHEAIFEIIVEDKRCFLRSPDRKIMSQASIVGAQNPMAFNEYILEKCWLAGDEEIKTVDSYFMGASGQLSEVLNLKEASIKKH